MVVKRWPLLFISERIKNERVYLLPTFLKSSGIHIRVISVNKKILDKHRIDGDGTLYIVIVSLIFVVVFEIAGSDSIIHRLNQKKMEQVVTTPLVNIFGKR